MAKVLAPHEMDEKGKAVKPPKPQKVETEKKIDWIGGFGLALILFGIIGFIATLVSITIMGD